MKKFKATISALLISAILFACQKQSAENQTSPGEMGGDVRIMQYNIRYGVGMDGVFDINRQIEVLKDAEADIIVLNEVDKHYSNRSNNMDMAKYISEKLGMNFVYRSSINIQNPPDPNREVGNAILTKEKIEHIETLVFSEGDEWPRVITKSRVDFKDGRTLYVAVSHYGLTESGRKKQATETIDFLNDVDNKPVIFTGDLNAQPDSEPLTILLKKYKDAFATRNSFFTFPANNPNRRIDYILGNDKITFRNNAKVLLTQASDHLPILVDLTF